MYHDKTDKKSAYSLTMPDHSTVVPRRLAITGMSCAGCVAAVETALRSVPGVAQASVNFAERTAQVRGDVSTATLIHAVQQAGYDAAELRDAAAEAERDAAEQAR